jgi:predicted SAM-dependent methyltransferase
MIRLNLGRGDKILPGYVNVDVAPSRARKQHDVICDLHQLKPFEDASADEVLAVHVVEHFGAGKWSTCCASGLACSSPARQ